MGFGLMGTTGSSGDVGAGMLGHLDTWEEQSLGWTDGGHLVVPSGHH